jgi:hypothetical protein
MNLFVCGDGKCQGFNQISQRMSLLFADFVDELIEHSDRSMVFGFCPQRSERNSPANAAVFRMSVTDIFGKHRLDPPTIPVILRMREHVSDVDFLPVVVNGCDQPKLVASDIKDCEPVNLVR